MEIVNNKAEFYAANFTSPEDVLLQEINDYTSQNHPHAHMLSGHVQGSFLSMISSLVQPQKILEIGTFTGYSALCMAAGLQPHGMLHTIELRDQDAATARDYFNRSSFKDQVTLHVGDAMAIIPALQEEWDLVFIDADKTGYIGYYELILPHLKQNGLIIADNVLFHGQVLEESITGKNAFAVNEFNQHVKNDTRVKQVMLTVRDGLLLIQKV